MTGNANWVCFGCRKSVRRSTSFQVDVPCPRCGQPCSCLGTEWAIPTSRNISAWEKLRESYWAGMRAARENFFLRALRTRKKSVKQSWRRFETTLPPPLIADAMARLVEPAGAVVSRSRPDRLVVDMPDTAANRRWMNTFGRNQPSALEPERLEQTSPGQRPGKTRNTMVKAL